MMDELLLSYLRFEFRNENICLEEKALYTVDNFEINKVNFLA